MTTQRMPLPRFLLIIPILALLLMPISANADATGTAFTYQGQLTLSGAAVNDSCDFEFGLWDASSSGSQIGATQTLSGVGVTNGLFIVSLDFGSSPWGGDARWLELAVRCPGGSGAYTTLSPRQELKPNPYALYAANAGSAPWPGLTSVPGPISFIAAPSPCSADEVPHWSGSTWTCSVDANSGGDITAVSAGTGLSGGGTSGAVTLSADTSVLQARVSGTCSVGNYIREVAADGTVTCGTDADSGGDITGVTAGAGMTGGGTSGTVSLGIATGGVTSSLISAGAVTATHVLSTSVQLRVSGSCSVGNYVRAVAVDGTVTCGADANSGGTITGSGATSQVAVWDGASSITGDPYFTYAANLLYLNGGINLGPTTAATGQGTIAARGSLNDNGLYFTPPTGGLILGSLNTTVAPGTNGLAVGGGVNVGSVYGADAGSVAASGSITATGNVSATNGTFTGSSSGWFPFTQYSAIPLTVNNVSHEGPVMRDGVIRDFGAAVYAYATNNGSNYWTITLVRQSDGVTIATLSTAAISAATWTRLYTTVSSAVTTSHVALYVWAAKTGSPGNLIIFPAAFFQ